MSSDKEITINMSQTIIEKCAIFADKRIEDSAKLYSLRGESNIQKIREDIVVGALAEFAVYDFLTKKGVKVTEPDLNIYPKEKKTFAADLKGANDLRIHVKSQTLERSKRYGASWLFQTSDRLLNLPGENEFLAFCIVDGTKVTIKAIVANIELVEANLTKKPKIPKYALTKNALYLDDIINSNICKMNLPNKTEEERQDRKKESLC